MILRIILAMTGFAANSLLCRVALKGMHIDAISFSSVRIISGALALYVALIVLYGGKKPAFNGMNAAFLCLYVFAFSIAYVSLGAATGALLLFGTVQLVMTTWGMWKGEKLTALKTTGMLGALAGILFLLLPGAERPPLSASIMMVIAGLAWALYSITGKKIADAAASVTGNFVLSVPVAVVALLLSQHVSQHALHADLTGLVLGVISGAVTSGAAYLLWYSLLPSLKPTTASTLQLSVPCLATLGGVLFLAEPLDLRIIASTVIILSGIGMVIWSDKKRRQG
nr:DMT family transporter [uncultured Enterobacter sp.]